MRYSFGSDSYARHYNRPSRGVEVGEYGASGFLSDMDDTTQMLLTGAIGAAAGATLMHFAIKHNWLGMGRLAGQQAQAQAQQPAQLPAQQQPAQAPTPASQGVRVVSVG